MSKDKMFRALDFAGRVCTDEAVGRIDSLLKLAKDASAVTWRDIQPVDVSDINKKDTLVRLQRNAMALATLLDQARDTALYLRQEISEIVKAEYEKEDAVKARQKAALQREIERETKRKYNKAQAEKETEETL